MANILFFFPHFTEMEPIRFNAACTQTPQPKDHDYLNTTPVLVFSTASQTDLTSHDMESLEEQAAVSPLVDPLDDFVSSAVMGSDERVNFYTGIDSIAILQGNFRDTTYWFRILLLYDV